MAALMRVLLMPLLLLSSCIHYTDAEQRFIREYDIDRPGAWTPEHSMWVIFPEWATHKIDRTEILRLVDSYIDVMEEEYPWCRRIHWEFIKVFIHNSLDRCVSGPGTATGGKTGPMWCYGWCSGYYMFVCWRTENGLLSEQNCLRALPHELFHLILQAQYGNSDTDHDKLFPLPPVHDTIRAAREGSSRTVLSSGARARALEYRYVPWNIPGHRE